MVCLQANGQAPIASFVSSSSQGCQPLNVQFTNTSQNAVSYQWVFGNGNTSTALNPSNVFINPGTYAVTLTVTSASGATATTTGSIHVITAPIASFSVIQATGCQHSGVITFQNNSTNNDSCLWDFGDGTTSNQTNPSHIYAIAGTFSVSLIAYNSQFGCSDVKTITSCVTISPVPQVSILVNDSITCDGSFNFQFSAVGSSASTWNWNFGDGTSSSLQNPSHVYADSGYYNISLIVASAQGCVDTIRKNNYIHIKFNPVALITTADTSGCAPFYTALITPYLTGTHYLWNLGDGTIDSAFTAYHSWAIAGTYPITLSVIYTSGCQNTTTFGPVQVYAMPSFNYSFTNGAGCAPLTVQFNNSSVATYTWLWTFGDGNTSSAIAPTHTYTTNGSYPISLTATSSNGCSLGYFLNGNVIVYAPSALFAPDVTSGCPPLSVNFTDHSHK